MYDKDYYQNNKEKFKSRSNIYYHENKTMINEKLRLKIQPIVECPICKLQIQKNSNMKIHQKTITCRSFIK